MKVKAAVLREQKKPYTIEELELEPPKAGEVLVKYLYCGYCHSDYSVLTGGLPVQLPLVAGHECAGIVEEVGAGVTTVKKGDRFVGTYSIPCGVCVHCMSGNSNLCIADSTRVAEGTLFDGTTRFKDKNGNPVRHSIFLAGFSTHSVVPEQGVIPVPEELPLDQACLLGCCVPTGWGTVTNIAQVKPGDSVAVYGAGGIGLNVIRAAALSNANPIVAVDVEASKEDLAYEFGATHFICNAGEDPVPGIQALTGGKGVQFAFEAIGDPGAIVQAWWSSAVGGKVVVPGLTHVDQETTLPLFFLALHQKSILGSVYGASIPAIDIPNLARMALTPDLLKLDKLVTHKFKLEQINDVVEAMAKRQIRGRWVCALE
jgi:S-(hydroxymethyl)glutathione dehydrogenase/alcohol dehydrogenase